MVRAVPGLALFVLAVSAFDAQDDVEKVADVNSAGGLHPEEVYPQHVTTSDGFKVGAEQSEHGEAAHIFPADDAKVLEVVESGTLGADSHISLAHDESHNSLTEIARSALNKSFPVYFNNGSELSVLQEWSGLKPEQGEKVPKFVKSFPGCQCSYEEGRGKWKCKGAIAWPPDVQGDKCCCCGLPCSPRNRCNNEQCMTIGVDQGPEIAAEQKRWEELMKGADILIGDETPGFIVDLGKGRCDQNRIIQGCQAKQLTPMCDHTSYARGGCWSPGKPGTRFHNRHWSHWGSHRQYFEMEDDYLFYGMCFYSNNPNALAPCNGDSHCWTNGNHRLSPNSRVLATGDVPNIHFNQISDCSGGLGCWRTICVKEHPVNFR